MERTNFGKQIDLSPVFKNEIPYSGVIAVPDPFNRFWTGWWEGKVICSTGAKEVCEQYLKSYVERNVK